MPETDLSLVRIALRKARESDLDAIWNNVWKDADLARMMLWEPTMDRDAADERMRRTLTYQARFPAFFVCLKDTDEAIGFAGVREKEPGVYEDSGICIARKYQNKGFGKEILTLLIELVFDELGGKKFVYGCFHENERSAAVCRALGFKYSHSSREVRDWDGYKYIADYYELIK